MMTSAPTDDGTKYLKHGRDDATPTTTMNKSTMDDANERSSVKGTGRKWKLPLTLPKLRLAKEKK